MSVKGMRVKGHLRRAYMDNAVSEIDDALPKFPEREIMKEAVHVEEPITSWDVKIGEGEVDQAVEECLAAQGLDLSFSSPLQVLEALTLASRENCGKGLCRRITAIAQISNFLELPFEEAYQKQPMELLQLLSFKGQDALTEARLLVATHAINPATIARILAESFLKGLLAVHRGGYMVSSLKEEGPAPLLWRPSDFIK